jgi:hypothetical protein
MGPLLVARPVGPVKVPYYSVDEVDHHNGGASHAAAAVVEEGSCDTHSIDHKA